MFELLMSMVTLTIQAIFIFSGCTSLLRCPRRGLSRNGILIARTQAIRCFMISWKV